LESQRPRMPNGCSWKAKAIAQVLSEPRGFSVDRSPGGQTLQDGADTVPETGRIRLDSERFRSIPRTCRPVCGSLTVP
jgi:hypothetical protein